MNKHYAFVDGKILATDSWYDFKNHPAGTVTYSPLDVENPWCRFLMNSKHWEPLDFSEVPSEFKVHLLLMGVPM